MSAARKVYQASQIRRVRATKSQVDERREDLYRIVQRMHPMSVRQVYYQATVHGIVEKTEHGYNKIQTDLVASPVVEVRRGVPRIHRRRPGDGLLAARKVLHDVGELATGGHGPDVEFVDRISDTVSYI